MSHIESGPDFDLYTDCLCLAQFKNDRVNLFFNRINLDPYYYFRFDQDQTNNTNVYVAGLPTSNFNLEGFANLMKKCGLIKPDEKTNQPKLKLYFDSEVRSN